MLTHDWVDRCNKARYAGVGQVPPEEYEIHLPVKRRSR